ncbi:uracil phosphoribosyltransferase [bacterium]|nr:uracil phosphoribosyltransferase [bacterium]
MEITIVSHSLSGIFLTKLRDKNADVSNFRETIESLTTVLFVESSKSLATETIEVETPFEKTIGTKLVEDIILIPIIRAGLGMVRPILNLYPQAIVMHIGAKRDEKTLETISYYSNINERIEGNTVFLLDPMLATGGTLSFSIDEIAKFSPERINILTVICAPEGIERVSFVADNSGIPIALWTAIIDRQLDDNGYILPGLGDAGDRIFGTI